MYDVVALGELLIDFTPAGWSDQQHPLYAQNPGGAPANVLACLNKLGHRTAFIGKVGQDQFGESLKAHLAAAGIDTQGLVLTRQCPTTLAFVHLSARGDRSFSFYRNPGADLLLQADEVRLDLIDTCRIFHFGAVSLTGEPARSATLAAVHHARTHGRLISFDPNLRLMLWDSVEDARRTVLAVLPVVDMLKISEEELQVLTGETDLECGGRWLLQAYPLLQLVLITLGPDGAFAMNAQASCRHPAFAVNTIDTTGAGDAFTGGILHQVLRLDKPVAACTAADLERFLAFANAAGSLATTRRGAIPAMPDLAEIEDCLAHTALLT
jgi:fructokinase